MMGDKVGDFSRVSPIDPEGKYFDAKLALVAEKFFRVKFGKRGRVDAAKPSSPDVVRANWREIRAPDLTPAERALAEPEIARMAAEARVNIARATKKWRDAFRDKDTHFDPGRPELKPIYVDVPPEELLARFGGYATESKAE